MRIYENPPTRKRKRTSKKRKSSSRRRRGPGGRFLAVKSRRKSMARKRRKSSKVKVARKRKSRKSPRKRSSKWYAKIGRKGAATRRRRRAARSRAAKKAAKSRGRKRPKYRARGRKVRPTLYRRRGKYYASPGSRVKGRRINPRRRRRSRGRRRNPGFALRSFFPTRIADFKDVAILGGGGAVGWLGVSMVNGLMDRFGVANLKAKVTSPAMASLVNAVQSAVSTFIVAGLAKTFIKKPEFGKAVFIGGAAKTVHSLVVPFLAQAAQGDGVVAQAADAALSGFQEQALGGFQESLSGYREYLPTNGGGMGYVADGLQAVALANAEGQGSAAFGM